MQHQSPCPPSLRLRPTAAASLLTLALSTALVACGGGSGDDSAPADRSYQVESGVAQKGPLTMGSSISINELNATTLVPLGTSYNFEIRDDFGNFQPAGTVFKQRLLETTASGYYLDELTGQVSTPNHTVPSGRTRQTAPETVSQSWAMLMPVATPMTCQWSSWRSRMAV